MQHAAHIGATIVIKGEITTEEPLAVAGRIEGRINAPGQRVTISSGGQLQADVTAAAIVVGGIVTGGLTAEQRIELQAGAEVQGDLKAPRVMINEGAFVRGKVDASGTPAADLARAS